MVREIMTSDCGILFDEIALVRNGITTAADSHTVVASEHTGPHEHVANKNDASQPIHDELKKKPFWWLLEIFPTQFAFQNKEGKWIYELG